MSEADRLLNGLDSDQRTAVVAAEPLVCIVAGAGSGKTSVLTRRIAYRAETGEIDDRHCVAITFTRQAANELHRRLAQLSEYSAVTTGTFHAVALSLLRRRWEQQGRAAPSLIRSRLQLVREVVGGRSLNAHVITDEIDWATARTVTAESYEEAALQARRDPGAPLAAVADVFREYATLKLRRRLIDFDDLLIDCSRELHESADFAAAARWQYRHLFVDEFQDVNPQQFRFLEALRQHRPDLTVVGDPNQAIFTWNGAEPELLNQIDTYFPGIRIMRLTTNYRCSAPIVEAANAVLNAGGLDSNGVAHRPDGPAVRYLGLADERSEIDAVIQAIRAFRSAGETWSRIAVLARTRAQLSALEEILRRQRIPFHIAGSRGLHDEEMSHLVDQARRFTDSQRLHQWAVDLTEPEHIGVPVSAARQAISTAVQQFLSLARYTGRSDGDAFASWWAATAFREAEHDAVELITCHSAKGREWPAVVAMGVELGTLPMWSARTQRMRDEETRLAYVACTRASNELLITWAMRRADRETGPSPLIRDRSATLDQRIERPVTEARRAVPTPNPVAEALARWRTAAGRAGRVDPQLVLTDDLLDRVVAATPRTVEELSAIPGLGASTIHRHGERILTAIAAANDAASAAPPYTST